MTYGEGSRRKEDLMLPSAGFEMIRHLDEELRQVSLRRFWWKYVAQDPEPARITEAEVIELVFGPHCEAEEPLGA
ncbi:MAG TPA: hypothetical protein VFP67_09230 [Acidimicrobiia bacterium]|nr:hypothetical protein [Acidimicrobiia bacterium]